MNAKICVYVCGISMNHSSVFVAYVLVFFCTSFKGVLFALPTSIRVYVNVVTVVVNIELMIFVSTPPPRFLCVLNPYQQ